MTYESVLKEQLVIARERCGNGASEGVVRAEAEERAQWLWLRWKCQNDLYFLGTKILGFEKIVDRKTGRKRLDPALHGRMAREMEREEDTLQMYPRGTMKSAWVKVWCVQKILQDVNVRIGFWSKTAGLARGALMIIKLHLKNPLLRQLFPEVIPEEKMWTKNTQDELVLWRDESCTLQDPQVAVWGVDATVVGHHYDYHVYDDVLDEKTVRTADGIEKLLDWWEHVQFIKDPSAVEKVIGTRYHLQDLYGYILNERIFDPKNISIVSIFKPGGTRSNYSFYTMPQLLRLKKRVGAAKFAAQMENRPVADEDRIFVPPYPIYDVAKAPEKRKYYISLDPAASVSDSSDESGFCVAFVDVEDPSRAYIREAYGVKKDSNALAEELLAKIVQYRPARVGIELGLQRALQALIDIKIKEWEGEHRQYIRPRFVPITVSKMDKALRLERTIGAMLKDRRVLLPGRTNEHGDIEYIPEMKQLIGQMTFYNPNSEKNSDDVVDACALMVQTIEHFSPSSWLNVKNGVTEDWFTMENIRKQFSSHRKEGWEKKFA